MTELNEIKTKLSGLLGIDVDLVRKEAIRKELKDTILKNTVIL